MFNFILNFFKKPNLNIKNFTELYPHKEFFLKTSKVLNTLELSLLINELFQYSPDITLTSIFFNIHTKYYFYHFKCNISDNQLNDVKQIISKYE